LASRIGIAALPPMIMTVDALRHGMHCARNGTRSSRHGSRREFAISFWLAVVRSFLYRNCYINLRLLFQSNAWARAPMSRQSLSRTMPHPQHTIPRRAWSAFAW
jgi:hypothetical protein